MNGSRNVREKSNHWRHSNFLALLEFALIAMIYLADWRGHIFLSKTPYLFALAWISLWLRGLHWHDVGFCIYKSWGRTLAIGILAGVGMELLELFCTQPLLARLFGKMPDLSGFNHAGNVKWLLLSLAFTWTLFAFGEELFFRGYLMDRISGVLGRTRRNWGITLVLVSFIFGLAHFGQGITGMSENFVDGMILGGLYLAFGRNLAVPIVAHGVTDTMDFLLIFFHRYPGLH